MTPKGPGRDRAGKWAPKRPKAPSLPLPSSTEPPPYPGTRPTTPTPTPTPANNEE